MDADRSRFEAVLAEFGSQIDRMLVAYERRDDLRDELRQEVALAIWRALPSFRGDSSLRNLIARITHNVGVSHVRKAVRGTPTELLDPELPIAAPDPQPEDLLLEADRIRRLGAAIRSLSLGQRQVVVLFLEDFNHAEIASTLGITESAVAVRLNRAKTRLAELLEEV
jgi:RNA polymerase sigma-70 factor (ECF subfamily)